MKKISCVICRNEPNRFFQKGYTLYSQCANCKTIFCGVLDQDEKIGGKFEVERNEKQNYLRVDRIAEICPDALKEELHILDWGAGTGYLVEDLIKAGYVKTDGFDPYTEKFRSWPEKNKYDVITCIETAEHFSHPFTEFDVMRKCLKDYGAIIIETGIVDAAIEDGHDLAEWFYLSPDDGHSTIYSAHGLDLIMALKGFQPRQHFNNYVKVYQKIPK